jgi:hypothetical protein
VVVTTCARRSAPTSSRSVDKRKGARGWAKNGLHLIHCEYEAGQGWAPSFPPYRPPVVVPPSEVDTFKQLLGDFVALATKSLTKNCCHQTHLGMRGLRLDIASNVKELYHLTVWLPRPIAVPFLEEVECQSTSQKAQQVTHTSKRFK